MRFKTFALSFAALLLLLPIALSYALTKYYARYDVIQKSIETALFYDDNTANAIKHATAASDMFHILRLAVNDRMAEKAVIKLGVLNEYIEQAIYPNDRDSAREIMKDLHNNYVGIEAAKLADEKGAFKIILSLAANRTLIVNRSYNPFFRDREPKTDVVAFGSNWFKKHRGQINARIEMKMIRANMLQPESPIKLSSLSRKFSTTE